ncbi:MAG TPA: thioesterase family protein [Stellaceae bacterium]|nr:thioesterase family protein [Stellaceae bacterium]
MAPWECDVTEHFTIAYYFDRVEQASTTLGDILGIADTFGAGVFPRHFNLRFTRELRAGDSFHVESAAIGLDPALRLGHRFSDSASGETVTWVEELWELPYARFSAEQRDAIERKLTAWEGPPTEPCPEPTTTIGAVPTARGRVKPADLDEFGRFALVAFVHRFTDAVLQVLAAIGMTSEYMKAARRGFSTFELALRIVDAPRLGDPYLVETGIAHLGNSSIRLLHRMSDPRTGSELARLSQFGVQLDLDARRPAPVPEEIRAAAAPLILSVD